MTGSGDHYVSSPEGERPPARAPNRTIAAFAVACMVILLGGIVWLGSRAVPSSSGPAASPVTSAPPPRPSPIVPTPEELPVKLAELLRKLREACNLEQYEVISFLQEEIVRLGHGGFRPVYAEATSTGEVIYSSETLYFTSLGNILLATVLPEDDGVMLGTMVSIDRRPVKAPTSAPPGARPTQETVILHLSGELLVKAAGPQTVDRIISVYKSSKRAIVKQALLQVMAKLRTKDEGLRKFLLELLATEQDSVILAEIIAALGEQQDARIALELYHKLKQLYQGGHSGGTLDALVSALLSQMKLSGTLPLLLSLLDQASSRTDPIELGAALAQALVDGNVAADEIELLVASLTAEKRQAQIAMLLKALSTSPLEDPRVAPLAHEFLRSSEDPAVRQAAVSALLAFEKDETRLSDSLNWAFDCGDKFVAGTTATQVAAYTMQHPEAGFAIDLLKKRALEGTPESRANVIEQMGAPWLWDATPDIFSSFLQTLQSTETDPKVQGAIRKALSGERNLFNYLSHTPQR